MDWQIWLVIGVILFIVEIFTPTMFFINMAIGAMFAAVPAFYGLDFMYQVICFGIVSGLSFAFLRPFLLNKFNLGNDEKMDVHAKYIGAQAKTVTEITKTSGRIAVFGEEWDARTKDDEVIPSSCHVIITSSEDIIMFVKKLGEK